MPAILTVVSGCRRACPTTSQCIGGVPWVVLCGAGRGGVRVLAVAQAGHWLVVIHGHWGGTRARHSAHTLPHSYPSGMGLRALGPWGSSGVAGERRTRWTP